MLRIDSRNMNFNGTGTFQNQSIISLSASINDPDNNAYVSIGINNWSELRSNFSVIKEDILAFFDEIIRYPANEEEEEEE